MSYLWKEFNIKTFAAETAIFRNGAFCPELSTLESANINTNHNLPVHIIYVGEIAGEQDLNINITAQNQPVYLSVDVYVNSPAKLNIFIKNAGENSELRGHVLLRNDNNMVFDCNAGHFAKNTGILVKTKLVAGRNSLSKLSGTAVIDSRATSGTVSDISFSALADKTARIDFLPAQRISAVPDIANHSASLYKPTNEQITYLRSAGLSGAEVDAALRDAFMNDFDLFPMEKLTAKKKPEHANWNEKN